MNDLDYYIRCFTHLHRATVNGGAPHKPVLLLSVIDCIERRYTNSERIYITPELVALFKSNWQIWVRSRHTMNFALPFYHMSSEPFWRLILREGHGVGLTKSGSIKSFPALNTTVDFALLDKALFNLLKRKENRGILKRSLIETYFPTVVPVKESGLGVLKEIAHDILHDSSEEYHRRIEYIRTTEDADEYGQQIFLRGGLFKRLVPKIYHNTCCITGLRIDTALNISMLDACHIVPFSITHDDTVRNGLALCPNLHRAFDRGLITIDGHYRVVVSDGLREKGVCSHSLRQFHGKPIHLPREKAYYPATDNLAWHNYHVFHA